MQMQTDFDAAVWQQVFALLEPVLPADWTEIALDLTYTDVSGSIDWRIADSSGPLRRYTAFPEIPRSAADAVFTEIDLLLMPKLRQLAEPWQKAALHIRQDGRFQVQYEYAAEAADDADLPA